MMCTETNYKHSPEKHFYVLFFPWTCICLLNVPLKCSQISIKLHANILQIAICAAKSFTARNNYTHIYTVTCCIKSLA